jgi:hypothetical protein
MNWRGKPLVSQQVIVQLIGSTNNRREAVIFPNPADSILGRCVAQRWLPKKAIEIIMNIVMPVQAE